MTATMTRDLTSTSATRPVCDTCHDEIIGGVYAVTHYYPDGTVEEAPVCRGCFFAEHYPQD